MHALHAEVIPTPTTPKPGHAGRLAPELCQGRGKEAVAAEDIQLEAVGDGSSGGGDGGSLASRLTVVITTSAVRSNPSTDLLRTAVASFDLVTGLRGCRIIIVADGPQLKPAGVYRPKQGFVDADGLARYNEYKANVRRLCGSGEPYFRYAELIALEKREGFGHAVKVGLERAETELVMVVQHDRSFMLPVDLGHAVRSFDAHPEVNYFMLPTGTVVRYRHTMLTRYGIDTSRHIIYNPCGPSCCGAATAANESDNHGGERRKQGRAEGQAEHRLVPLLFWFDSTHVARREAYMRIVFEAWSPEQGKLRVRRGDFIEVGLGLPTAR